MLNPLILMCVFFMRIKAFEYDLSLGVNSKAQMFYGYRRLPFT